MKKLLVLYLVTASVHGFGQKAEDIINVKEVTRLETTLASDDMRGRKAGTADACKAAAFIAEEFKKAGLQPVSNGNYLQQFSMLRSKMKELKAKFEGADVDTKNIVVLTAKVNLEADEKSGFAVEYIKAGDNFQRKALELAYSNKNSLVVVDTSFQKNFSRLAGLKRQLFSSQKDVVFILANMAPKEFQIKAEHEFSETKFANVVGILPGKSRKNELVIFSGHYDHLGIAKTPVGTDSIYNGANDDAAGVTAVITLANYYKKINNNERTLVFAAFTAEEIGGFGSQYFSRQFNPADVVAMFNIEMIGTEAKWGKNSAYITGYEKTDMGKMLQQNLKGSDFTFYPDPYTDQDLFYRSDNATLARLGVPAHTISTAKMDSEPNYHKLSDEVSTLDLDNMAAIITAIAVSSKTIVSGKEAPSRVKPENLR
ncbi:MAG: aminopeptidase [Chitinophagaceae bacterium]